MSNDIGAKSKLELSQFLKAEVFRNTVFLVLEHFNEGMAALHLHCGWPIKELMYLKSHCSDCGHVLRRWDGRTVPPKTDATAEEIELVKGVNTLDSILYNVSVQTWERIRQRGGQSLAAATAEYSRQLDILNDYCSSVVRLPSEYADHPGCFWLALNPREYSSAVNSQGFVTPNAVVKPNTEHFGLREKFPVKEMLFAYNTLYRQKIGSS